MRTLRFSRWELTDDVSLSALLPMGSATCGIYVLEFSDGEFYVGKTVNLLGRIADHRRRWPDEITAIRFTPVPRRELDRSEQDVIGRLVDQGESLRNIDLVTLPLRSEALDLVVDHAVQESWLAGDTVEFDVLSRVAVARQRARTEARYQRLSKHPEFPAILESLGAYVRTCIPQPDATEWRFWVVTSLPSTGGGRRLSALSINNVEVLVLGGSKPGRVDAGFLNVAYETNVPARFRGVASLRTYRTTGDVIGLDFEHPSDVARLLDDPEIAAGARRLALGLLRKGRGMFGRFHDFNLADAVFRAWPGGPEDGAHSSIVRP